MADVTLTADEARAIAPLADVLGEALVLGELDWREGDTPAVAVRRSPGGRCERCWRRRRDVDGIEGLCTRCRAAVAAFDARS